MFGARQRNIQDNFLKKQEILQNQASNIKKLNRLQQKLDYDISCYRKNTFQHQMETKRQQWNNVIQKVSKIVFMDTPPIVLNKNKKVPTPPNSPRIQKIEDKFDQYQNIKTQKINKGYKNKTQSAQKRKATENYKQEKIAKERKNAEKTKEKVNRRATILI